MHNTESPTLDELQNRFAEACQLHQENRLQEAKSIYLEILEHIPNPLLFYNIGLIHHAEEDFASALQCFEKAAEAMPEDPDCLFNLALCLKECDRLEDSVTIYNKVISLEPENHDAIYNLASCHRLLKEYSSAIDCYLQVLEIHPDHKSAVNNLAYVYQLCGDTDQAVRWYQRLLELDPSNEAAQHMLSALTGTTPSHSPDSYVRDVFDNYSIRYEQSLVAELKYSVPEKLHEALAELPDSPEAFQYGFDLGCGTGLGAVPFKDAVQVFDGVDLSQKMIDIAAEKEIYSSLFTGNICDALKQTSARYDFLLAADVFAYVGELDDIFRLAAECTLPGCCFLFSTETATEDNYILRSTGRFAHSTEYVRGTAEKYGWRVLLSRETNLRMDKGEWVTGNIWILKY